jgi:transposase
MTELSRADLESRRLLAAVDLANGIRPCEVARKYEVSRTTASRWKDMLKKDGPNGLRKRTATGRPKRLTPDQLAEVARIIKQLDVTTAQLSAIIETRFGVRYHPDYAGKLAHRLFPDEPRLFAGHRGPGKR